MKRSVIFLVLILLSSACQDVIEIEVPTTESRLIVDALIRIDINDELIPFEIKVTKTNSFFEEIPVTSLEKMVLIIKIIDENGSPQTGLSTFSESEPDTGIYIPDPCCDINEIYTSILEYDPLFTLIIEHEGKKYFAESRYTPVVPIEKIEQGDNTLFGENETEVIVTFTDTPNQSNFYLFDFSFDKYLLTDDKFYEGQQFTFSYFYDQEFKSGNQIDISILGVDKAFSDYMDQLLTQSEEPQGPFQTPVSTVRGNVFDITGLDNIAIFDNVERPNDFALGYFAVVQELKQSLIIE